MIRILFILILMIPNVAIAEPLEDQLEQILTMDYYEETGRLVLGAKLIFHHNEQMKFPMFYGDFTYQGKKFDRIQKPENHYRLELVKEFNSFTKWEWMTPIQNPYINQITLNEYSIRYYYLAPTQKSLSNPFYVLFNFDPIDPGHTVTGYLDNVKVEVKEEGARFLKFSLEDLKSLKPGKHSLRLVRCRQKDLNEPSDQGGFIKACYHSKSREITFTEK